MIFTGKGKLKIEITCMKARYKILIIFLQLFAFFCYIGCFVYLTYKADKELIFVDIPVKYTKGDITGKEYGITITKDRGSHTIHLESNKFPDKHFKAHYYMSFPYPQRSFDSIIESHPKPCNAIWSLILERSRENTLLLFILGSKRKAQFIT